jgi:hypothetical protein
MCMYDVIYEVEIALCNINKDTLQLTLPLYGCKFEWFVKMNLDTAWRACAHPCLNACKHWFHAFCAQFVLKVSYFFDQKAKILEKISLFSLFLCIYDIY